MPVGDPAAGAGAAGRGCWEASVGLHAMLRRGRDARARTRRWPRPRRWPSGPRPTRGSAPARRGSAATSASAWRCSPSVLDPAVVVLGGYFVPLGDLVLGPARRTLEQRLVGPVQRRPSCGSGRSASRPPRWAPPSGRSPAVFSGERRAVRPEPAQPARRARTSSDARCRRRGDRVDEERLEGHLGGAEQHRVARRGPGTVRVDRLQGARAARARPARRRPRPRPACRATRSSRPARPPAG